MRLVQSILSSRASNGNNVRKAISTDPIRETEELENMKIASYSMENILNQSVENMTENKLGTPDNTENHTEESDNMEHERGEEVCLVKF